MTYTRRGYFIFSRYPSVALARNNRNLLGDVGRHFQKKSPRRPLIVAGHCRRLLLLLRRS